MILLIFVPFILCFFGVRLIAFNDGDARKAFGITLVYLGGVSQIGVALYLSGSCNN